MDRSAVADTQGAALSRHSSGSPSVPSCRFGPSRSPGKMRFATSRSDRHAKAQLTLYAEASRHKRRQQSPANSTQSDPPSSKLGFAGSSNPDSGTTQAPARDTPSDCLQTFRPKAVGPRSPKVEPPLFTLQRLVRGDIRIRSLAS